MAFLLVFPKSGVATDRTRLASLLCPYRGELQRIELPRGTLFASSLAEVTNGEVSIPAGTRRNAQTAWLHVQIGPDGVRFETDPLGTFPLWVAEDASCLIVTGEVKSLVAVDGFRVAFEPERWPANRKRPADYSPYANVRRVAPGAVLRVSPDLQLTEQPREPLDYNPTSPIAERDRAARLDETLRASARAIAEATGPWGALVSGGIDSSLATALLKRHHDDLRTYTLGTKYANEFSAAAQLAAFVGARHAEVGVSELDAIHQFDRAVFCNETIDGLTAETLAQLGVLLSAAAGSVRRVVTGYGADLLFGSMLRHELYMKVTGVDDLRSLIERTCWSGEFAPFYAWALGIEVHHLFWDPQVMNCAFQIPPEASFDGVREKLVMRSMAVERGYMKAEHAFRDKQALTDGTQFNRLLSEACGLPDKHAYDGKTVRAVATLRQVFAK